jgi:redox-sensitive bicupin YhaK (pirin superfamily)
VKTILHKASTRGHSDHGWLDAWHTFSFSDYYDPYRVNFGTLRVLNDDCIAPASGFPVHLHKNMEIITIALLGEIEHQDSMNNKRVIKQGEVQVMSAGTGIYHSEYNPSKVNPVNLLQIWVLPDKQDINPRYDQIKFPFSSSENLLKQIVSPNKNEGLWIQQQSWFSMGTFSKSSKTHYLLKKRGHGVYVFVIEGSFTVNDFPLSKRDGLGISDTISIDLKSEEDKSVVLLMEVPMTN